MFQESLRCSILAIALGSAASVTCADERPAILLTGYWPPSNEAIRHFSPNQTQNPQGWQGANWEGRGYDIYAYFPEFMPANCVNCGKGTGDLEVDYQDTSANFWPIANSISPIAIITFSRGLNNLSWELEMNQFNRINWINDYVSPFKPTPNPPDASVPLGFLRNSTLPVEAIVSAVDAEMPSLDPFVCYTQDGGGFLSEFIAYHGVWYQDIHKSPSDPSRCIAAGHVHVGGQIPWATARLAAETSLRVLLAHVDDALYAPQDLDHDGCVGSGDLAILLGEFGGCSRCDADFDGNGSVDARDLGALLGAWNCQLPDAQ